MNGEDKGLGGGEMSSRRSNEREQREVGDWRRWKNEMEERL